MDYRFLRRLVSFFLVVTVTPLLGSTSDRVTCAACSNCFNDSRGCERWGHIFAFGVPSSPACSMLALTVDQDSPKYLCSVTLAHLCLIQMNITWNTKTEASCL
jgi:hypothetical protein